MIRRRDEATTAAAVSRALRHLLTWDDLDGACRIADADETDAWELLINTRDEDRAAWDVIASEAVRDWTTRYPGTRPAAWWEFDAPELRGLTGGAFDRTDSPRGRCFATGIPHIARFNADPPMVEAEAAYLDRLGLWLPGERARVSAAAFAPRVFDVALIRRSNFGSGDDL